MIFFISVRPPQPQTSGCRISTARCRIGTSRLGRVRPPQTIEALASRPVYFAGTGWTDALAGLYRDGAFIGQTYMPFLAQDEEATLPFGAVDGLSVERQVRSREEGDVGVLTTSSRRTERFEIVAESALPYPVTMTVYDRLPASEDKQLEVSVTARPEPSETDVDGKRGVLAWTFELPAGGERRIQFGYDLDWPSDQNLILDHFPRPIPY